MEQNNFQDSQDSHLKLLSEFSPFLPNYLTTSQAAKYLQVSTQWLEIGHCLEIQASEETRRSCFQSATH